MRESFHQTHEACGQCSKKVWEIKSVSKSVGRSIICEECNLPRRTYHWSNVCGGCLSKLPKVRCQACSRLWSKLELNSPFCRRCAPKYSNLKTVCETCGMADYPFLNDPGHCRKCHRKARHKLWLKSMHHDIVCNVCGLTKPSYKKTERICGPCYEKRRGVWVKCIFSGCVRLTNYGSSQLCKRHYEDRRAPKALEKYVRNYRSPFPQNERYFAALTAKLRLNNFNAAETNIRERELARYRAIGEYLKTCELPERLTWRAIEDALPKLSKRARDRTKAIRSCLLELGNLFLQEGLWNSYRQERLLEKYLKSTPRIFVEYVAAFERWASHGMLNPNLDVNSPESQPLTSTTRAILGNVKAVGLFLKWCVNRDIFSLADVSQSTIQSYKETLFWQYECKACGKRTHVDVDKTNEKCSETECQAMKSCVKIRRLTHRSVSDITMKLRTFFNWAQLHDLVLENPLANEVAKQTFTAINERGEMIEISECIRRYDDDVVERLCRYMVSPDADPEEALVLYLIIFHLLTVTELCKAKIPSLAAETPSDMRDRAKDFEYLLLPVRKPTRRRLSRGREDPIMKYPKESACWLRPLLQRYFKKRRNGVGSEYLFVGQCHRTRNNRPVTHRTIGRLIHRASQRVVNGMISPRDLRNTAAAIRADMSKRRGAILTKLGYTSERAIRFNHLETFLLVPRQVQPIAPAPSGGVAKGAVRGAPSARAKRAQGGELIK